MKSLSILEKGEIGLEAANVYNNLGIISEGELKKDYHQKALNIRRRIYGEVNPDVAKSWGNLGMYYLSQNDYSEAIKCCEKSLSILLEIHKEVHPSIAESYLQLGSVYDENGAVRQSSTKLLCSFYDIYIFFHHTHPKCLDVYRKNANHPSNPKAITLFEEKVKDGKLNEDDKSWYLFIVEKMS